MTPDIEGALSELRASFPENQIEATPDEQGGAYVVISALPLGAQYQPAQAWLGFAIGFQYPASDIYPLFTDSSLARIDGAPLGEGFQQSVQWNGRETTQISRRSNRWNPAEDTAALKVAKVLAWLGTR